MSDQIDSPFQNPLPQNLNDGPVQLPSFVEECFKEFKDYLQSISSNTLGITGIETSLGQIGCRKDDDGNIIGVVLVCKVSDTTQDPIVDVPKIWYIGHDGTVDLDYQGEWEACANLQTIADLLQDLIDLNTCEPKQDMGVLNDWAALAA